MFKKILLVLPFVMLMANAQTINDAVRLGQEGIGYAPRALALGNSYVALSDDSYGIGYNPAGIGFMRKMEWSTSLSYQNFYNDATLFNKTLNGSRSSTDFSSFNFILPFPTVRGSFVVGMSYNQQKNFNEFVKFEGFNPNSTFLQDLNVDTNIPYDLYLTDTNFVTKIAGKLTQSGSNEHSGALDNYTLAASLEIYPNLFLGGALNIVSGKYTLERDYYEDDYDGIYNGVELSPGDVFTRGFRTFEILTKTELDYGAVDFKAGFLYQLQDIARFGLTIKTPQVVSVEDALTTNASSYFADGTVKSINSEDYSDKVKYKVSTPWVFTAGVAVNLAGFILTNSATFKDNTQIEFYDGEGISSKTLDKLNNNIANGLRATIDYGVGLEAPLPMEEGIKLRIGYNTQQSPYKDDDAAFNKKYYTGGIGFVLDGSVSFDVTYSYGSWNNFSDNYGDNTSRVNQEIKQHNVFLGFAYRF